MSPFLQYFHNDHYSTQTWSFHNNTGSLLSSCHSGEKIVQGVFQEDWGRLESDGMQGSHGEEGILGAQRFTMQVSQLYKTGVRSI